MSEKKRKDIGELWDKAHACALQSLVEHPNPASRLEATDAFCRALDLAGLSYRRIVWFPDRCASFLLNCGHLADVLVENRLALVLDTDNRALRKLRDSLPGLLASSACDGAGVLIFAETLLSHYTGPSSAPTSVSQLTLSVNRA